MIQKNAYQLLDEYDRLEEIQPSPEWENTLLTRMEITPRAYFNWSGGFEFTVLVAFFILINAVAFLKISGQEINQLEKRNEVLLNISAELLINPDASN